VTYRAKDAKQGDPEDEENQAPHGRHDADVSQHEGDEVHDARHCGERADDNRVHLAAPVSPTGTSRVRSTLPWRAYPFRVGVFVQVVRIVQVLAVQAADGQGEGKAHQVQAAEGEVAGARAEEAHCRGRGRAVVD